MPNGVLVSLVVVSVLLPRPEASQRQPDFSGHWVLAEALVSGATRGSSGTRAASGGVPTTTNTISGAPFNCGRACTITHKGQALTIDHAQLADYVGRDKSRPTPAVTLRLDGREITVVNSFNPHLQIPVTATWHGDRLQIDSRRDPVARTQSLSLEGEHLVVVSVTHLNGERRSELTFRYKKNLLTSGF